MSKVSNPWAVTIGSTVRRLRHERRWTLDELAELLDLSESRLSELERGKGSFSAEHLLRIFRHFQVGPEDFAEDSGAGDPVLGSLQAALVRFGARHLVADEAYAIRREHDRPVDVVLEVLIRHPNARFVAALAPVLVVSEAELSFPVVQHGVVQAGVPNRWGWLLDHFLEALAELEGAAGSHAWRRASRRSRTVAEHFLVGLPRPDAVTPFDPMDLELRSPRSLRAAMAGAMAGASPIDQRWRVLGPLRSGELRGPLEALRDEI